MSTPCTIFHAELERALAGPKAGLELLTRAEHARTCAGCAAELARERALDRLLERLPEPEVPVALAGRTLARLVALRVDTPRSERELDELLAGVPAPRAPVGLSGRVLAGLAKARGRPSPRRDLRGWRVLLAAAAVILALSLLARSSFRGEPGAPEPFTTDTLPVDTFSTDFELAEDADLLAYALERWELLQDEDLDVWLASLDPLDEVLLELAGLDDPEGSNGQPARTDGGPR